MGIICETEYFGLEHWVPNQKESRTHQWINLRNRLSYDGGSSSGIQLMLALRVKFWVPVHFILQENVRNIFYMQAKADLLEGRLFPKSWSNAAKLAALLCQADGLRFNEASLTSECPLKIKREQERLKSCYQQQQLQLLHNHQRLQHQQPGANIKERKEKDYVLSFKKRRLSKQKSVENIDNTQLSSQASTSNATSTLTTNPTSNVRQTEHNKSTSSTKENSTKVSEDENSTCDKKPHQEPDVSIKTSPLRIYQDYIIRPTNEESDVDIPEDFLKQIAIEHSKLSMLKMSPASAKYWLLQEIQDLPGYGEEVFSGITTSENSQSCDIAVGAHGIKVSIGDNERKYVVNLFLLCLVLY